MKKTYRYLMLALAGTAILSGCGKKDDDKHADETEASVSTEAAAFQSNSSLLQLRLDSVRSFVSSPISSPFR